GASYAFAVLPNCCEAIAPVGRNPTIGESHLGCADKTTHRRPRILRKKDRKSLLFGRHYNRCHFLESGGGPEFFTKDLFVICHMVAPGSDNFVLGSSPVKACPNRATESHGIF